MCLVHVYDKIKQINYSIFILKHAAHVVYILYYIILLTVIALCHIVQLCGDTLLTIILILS